MKKYAVTIILLAVFIFFGRIAIAAEDLGKYYPGDWRTAPQSSITKVLQQQNVYNGNYRYKVHKHDRSFFLVESGNRLFKVSIRRNTVEEVK